ncbi:MAG: SMC family ATPase [Acidimicrobiia bacterium]|nr:SMC family ATPase [Acidimicrobiia bacterium]
MRPRRLELEGFTAFRNKTIVDFEGADLFAFVGPTGSGKSSLVDAILFALYGIVPRYGDKRAVEPVVSLGKNEARVRFDFSVGDTNYSAARVVRRTKTGATTAEARLEGGAEPIMGADEVTEAVEALLGLGFDHFTKCVVLPQGQFAAFLHDSAAKRQELLRQLLDLGRYRRIREVAVERQRLADARVEVLTTQINDLAFATEAALEAAETRRVGLAALRDEIDALEPELEQTRRSARLDEEAAANARRNVEILRSVASPAGLAELVELADQVSGRLAAAQAAATEAAEQRRSLDEQSAGLADAAAVARLSDLHQRLAHELETEKTISLEVDTACKAATAARAEATAAEVMFDDAVERIEGLRREHAAHALAAHLAVGEPCPVCHQRVESIPALSTPAALEAAEREADRLRVNRTAAATAAAQAGEALAAIESRYTEGADRIAVLRDRLAGQPDADETLQLQKARTDLDTALRAGREMELAAVQAVESARREGQDLARRVEEARRQFDATRDKVAALAPPTPKRERLDADWSALVQWAVGMADELSVQADAKAQSVEEAAAAVAAHEQRFAKDLAALDLAVGDRKARDVCVDALAAATQQVEHIASARVKAAGLAKERDAEQESALIAKSLAHHLAANGFEGWVMAEALEALVQGANLRLDDLSSGAFSLELEKREFRVIDHRNADERRSVKTLSGGETFLVSLALALALAEELASMSAQGVARLESMFLDEGFGALDAETLDVVATVIHELGSDGRMIGLITHVKDLADQVPVRFEIRKGPGGATVERVDA